MHETTGHGDEPSGWLEIIWLIDGISLAEWKRNKKSEKTSSCAVPRDELDSGMDSPWNVCNTCSRKRRALSILNCFTEHFISRKKKAKRNRRWRSNNKSNKKRSRKRGGGGRRGELVEARTTTSSLNIQKDECTRFSCSPRFYGQKMLFFFGAQIISLGSYCESISETIALRSATKIDLMANFKAV